MLGYRMTFQGAWEVSALVSDGVDCWLEHCQYFDYTKREAGQMFRQRVREQGYRIVRGY